MIELRTRADHCVDGLKFFNRETGRLFRRASGGHRPLLQDRQQIAQGVVRPLKPEHR
jgi:hypothetical protein